MSRAPVRKSDDPAVISLQDSSTSPDKTDPRLAPQLRAHSIATLIEARKTIGSRDGARGPRAMLLAGFVNPLDGGEGVFVWDDNSTTADDEGIATISPAATATAPGRWIRTKLYPTQNRQLIRAPQSLTAGTTFAPAAGTKAMLVEQWAAGGGGGGTTSVAVSAGVGGGGAAGGYLRRYVTTILASHTIAIGAAGTAGGATGATGGTGGDTTFSDGTTTSTAKGGLGGVGQAGGTAAGDVLGGAAGGASTNGDVNGSGAPGGSAYRTSGTVARSGAGGSSSVGGGGNASITQGVGAAGTGFGSGGAGGCTLNGGAAVAGGAGTGGLIVVWEFS